MTQGKRDIREISREELYEYIHNSNEKPFRVIQMEEWLWQKGAVSFDQMTTLSKSLREKLNEDFSLHVALPEYIQQSTDGTVKSVFRLYDQYIVESVLIPSRGRATACISSQVGCPFSCSFCATGRMKYKRNLTEGEIFDQVVEMRKQAEKKMGISLSNIVFMGMGEPLLNYDNVLRAIHFITSKQGLEFSPGRITLSTVGIVKMIKKLADDKVKFNLAVSLHAASEKKRNMLIPVNKTNTLDDLAEALRYFHSKTKTRITFEYLMLKGFNDSLQDARELAVFCKNVPCKINIIEYNPVEGIHFEKPDKKTIDEFMDFLESKNLIINLRRSRGKDIDAACGQLAGKVEGEIK